MRRILVFWVALMFVSLIVLSTWGPVQSQQIKPADKPFTPPQNTSGPFRAPQFLLETLGRTTTQGDVKLKGYSFYEKAPGPDGNLLMPDGSGGTYGLKCRLVAGPLNDAQAVCQAIKQVPAEYRATLMRGSGRNWSDTWDCSDEQPTGALMARLEGTEYQGDQNLPGGGIKGGLPGAPTAKASPIVLNPGELPSVSRGIYVKGWKRNTIDRVELCFPGQRDLWATNDNNIVIFPGNSSEDPANMSGYPNEEYYFPLLWRARCQSKPGPMIIEVHIQQRRFPGESAASPPEHGECVPTPGRVTLLIPVTVTADISINCTLTPIPPTFFPAPPSPLSPPGTGGGNPPISPPQPPQPPGSKPTAKWKTNFGDITIQDNGGGNVTGTLGDGGSIKGVIKDRELIVDFIDKSGDGKISVTLNPDGKTFKGDWIRTRGPGAGKSGSINGQPDDPGGQGGPGSGKINPDPGPGGNKPPTPGGPATPALPPLAPVPASVQRMTLQVPEFRVMQGQRLQIPIWLINGQNLANMDWNMHFNPLVVTPLDIGNDSITRRGNLLAGQRFESNVQLPGVAYFAFGQREGGIAGTGTVGLATFQAVGPPGSRTPLTLATAIISDPNGGKLPIDLIHGFVEIIKPIEQIPGGNGGGPGVTFKDAQDALKMAVKLIPENLNLDLDRDGRVSSRDAVLIMRRAYLYFGKDQP